MQKDHDKNKLANRCKSTNVENILKLAGFQNVILDKLE